MAPNILTVHSPYDRTPVGEVFLADATQAETALAEASALKTPLPKHERIAILTRLAALMRRDFDKLLHIAICEGGKPYVDSKVEVSRAILGVETALVELKKMAGAEIPMGLTEGSAGRWAFTIREPIGLVLAISAFNHPLNLIVHQVVPAVAVGAPVIVKPALTTPLSCLALMDLLYEAGLPPVWARALVCENDLAEKLATDSRVRYFSFIGSAKVGWYLRGKLAPGATYALEHGGAAPVVLAPDADEAAALSGVLKGGYYHAGQVCVSVQRVYAHKNFANLWAQALAAKAKALRTHDPFFEDTEVGPLILPREVRRVHEWVQEAVEGGAVLYCGGEPLSETCYAPTVLFNPPEAARVTTQEIFGPVVCVYEYDTLDDAYTRANALPYTFQAAIYTRALETAFEATRRLKGRAVMVNDHTAFRVDWAPFGGTELSGAGTGGIGYAMREMTVEKMVVFRSSVLD